jgi:hypothetical protein
MLFILATNAVFSTYDLRTSIGPLSGTPVFNPGGPFRTTGGNFILNSVKDNTSTFTATAVGDPHFTTYRGVHYDYQGVGDFLLARSTVAGDQFDVQVHTTRVSGAAVSIMTEAAATLCNHNVTFEIDRANSGESFVWVDGSPTSLGIARPVLALGSCTIHETSPEHYKVVWDTGEILDITNNNGTYLDLSSSLSWIDELGSMEGLLATDINPDAWRMTEGSLFDPVPEPTTFSILSACIGFTWIAVMRRGRLPKRN